MKTRDAVLGMIGAIVGFALTSAAVFIALRDGAYLSSPAFWASVLFSEIAWVVAVAMIARAKGRSAGLGAALGVLQVVGLLVAVMLPGAAAPADPGEVPRAAARRFEYSLNLAILVFAAAAILVMVNYFGYRHYARWYTNRQLVVSEQTEKVIDQIETNVTITTLFVESTQGARLRGHVIDLLDEYERRSGRITVEHIDPAAQPTAYRAFVERLMQRYADVLTAGREAIEEARVAYQQAAQFSTTQAEALGDLLLHVGNDRATAEFVLNRSRDLRRYAEQLPQAPARLGRLAGELMSELSGLAPLVIDDERLGLEGFAEQVLRPARAEFQRLIDDDRTPAALKDALRSVLPDYRALDERIRSVVAHVRELDLGDYPAVRANLAESNSVVVARDGDAAGDGSGGRGVVVISPQQMFSQFATAPRPGEERGPEVQSVERGEEALTGALVRLTRPRRVKVVFVNPDPISIYDFGPHPFAYTDVIDRLAQMNIAVAEWQPGGYIDRTRRPQNPRPRPVAQAGQTLVMIFLPPSPPQNNRTLMAMAMRGSEAARAEAARHLAAGQPTLIITAPNPQLELGVGNELLKPLRERFGLSVQTGRTIAQIVPEPDGKAHGAMPFVINTWPDDHALGRAVGGLPALIREAQAILLPDKAPEGVTLSPIATTPSNTWAERDVSAQVWRPDEGEPRGPFTFAVAAERGEQRAIVLACPTFATDGTVQQSRAVQISEQMAALISAYPGNAELFVNAIYWLGGMDDLIAPGARVQDTPRIGAVSEEAMITIRWVLLLGMPLLCLATGAAVWFVRRK